MKETTFKKVDVCSLFAALQRNGVAKLSDHFINESPGTSPEGQDKSGDDDPANMAAGSHGRNDMARI